MAVRLLAGLMQDCVLHRTLMECGRRTITTSSCCLKNVAAKPKTSKNKNNPITYEMKCIPSHIAHRKSWLSWNTSTLQGGLRTSETAVEDLFIRKFMAGTFHGLLLTEVIIKRQHNIIRIAGIYWQPTKKTELYFRKGFAEELLSHWLQCIVKLEFQITPYRNAVIVDYI